MFRQYKSNHSESLSTDFVSQIHCNISQPEREQRRFSVQFCPNEGGLSSSHKKDLAKLHRMSSSLTLSNGTKNGFNEFHSLHDPNYTPKIKKSPKKLVIHFDARNTVFVADLFSRISVEHALNTYIAGVTWGVCTNDGSWKCISTTPSLLKPQEDAISLYKLTERQIVRKPEDRAILRRVLGNFTDTPDGKIFSPLFKEHLELLRWPFPEIDAKLTVMGLDSQPYHYLLPAFYELIKDLYLSGQDFCVMVRTFGRDASHILTAVRRFTMGLHPLYPHYLNLPVMKEEQVLTREADGLTYTYIDERGQKKQLTNEKDIYEHWYDSYGVLGVVDDFNYWQNNAYHYSASKPLWFDAKDNRVHHIMFDDNIRMEDDDNIINLKEFLPHSQMGRDLSPQEGLKYENIYYVQADLLSSIEDENYFIKMVNICQENLTKLHNQESPPL